MDKSKTFTSYKKMHNMMGRQIFRDNAEWTDLWGVQPGGVRENYFVSYAVEGPIGCPCQGTRFDMPKRYPLKDSPVIEPSPLNSEKELSCNCSCKNF